MEKVENNGFYIVVLNIMLCMFIYTSDKNILMTLIVSLFSTFIAICLNYIIIKKRKNIVINLRSFILNIIVFWGINIYLIYYY